MRSTGPYRRGVDDDVYRIAGAFADDTGYVQDSRRIAADGVSYNGKVAGRTRAIDIRRPGGCDGLPADRLGNALLKQRSGGNGFCTDCTTGRLLQAAVPFLHFFDGFRTSHEIQKVEELTFDDMRAMIDDELVAAVRARALTPDRPMIAGTAQNPDVYFQGREVVNKFYLAMPGIVQETMNKFAKLVGRQYHLFDYVGAADAEKVIIIMGSGAETVHETVEYLASKGEKVGVLKVRLFRPFSGKDFINALPKTVKKIAVLDRTKEPGALGEPLYMDVRTAIGEAMGRKQTAFKDYPVIVGGRYGLGSKEFTPAMVKAVFDNLDAKEPKNGFTVGIIDDVAETSLDVDESFVLPSEGVYTAMFYGLGSDGTVGANHNSIQIIGQQTDNNAQGYFVYDSKKAGQLQYRTCVSAKSRFAGRT